MDSRLYSNTCR